MNGLSSQVDGSRSLADAESAQEYKDNDFRDELEVSAPTHPLFPTSLNSNNTVNHKMWGSQNWQTGDDRGPINTFMPGT